MKNILISFLLLTGIATAQDNNNIVSKYDFIPGEKVIFYDDFSAESVGDFPAAWNTSGSGEIVTMSKFPGRWFQLTKAGYYIPEAKEPFTENFTVEFDFVPMLTANSEFMYGLEFLFISGTLENPNENGAVPGKAGIKLTPGYDEVSWTNYSERDEGYKDHGSSTFQFKVGEKYHIAFWIQKQRIRMYSNEDKILDLPRGMIAGYAFNIFRIQTSDEATPAIASFRIAAGLPDLRSKLLKEGKIISYGITFDVNSDKVKPESYPTLKEIADVLKETPGIRVQIVGHTDSDGEDASNLDLSRRRAASVKSELTGKFGITADRLDTDGKGESVPLAPNDSPINKAKNRRVEFISVTPAKSSLGMEAGTLTDPRDHKVYRTVKVGTQTWMAENLAYKASNGCWSYAYNQENVTTFGHLYSWEIAKSVCPSGWHLPSDTEWSAVTGTMGGEAIAGGKMKEKETVHWQSPNAGATDESGFAALPGGFRSDDGSFNKIGQYAALWSSTQYDPQRAWYMLISNEHTKVIRNYADKKYGVSVRCLKD